MNERKEGRPYRFPGRTSPSLPSSIKVGFHMTYREVQGVTRALSEYVKPLKETHFTQAGMRIIRMVMKRKPADTAKVEGGEKPWSRFLRRMGLASKALDALVGDVLYLAFEDGQQSRDLDLQEAPD